mmetsp:Transcript_39946/g.115537  ORF Transcript_39946/g.115537 Transcript_39946/m.115537 type:complete len:90 (+) Transcript_39946:152-421(+)
MACAPLRGDGLICRAAPARPQAPETAARKNAAAGAGDSRFRGAALHPAPALEGTPAFPRARALAERMPSTMADAVKSYDAIHVRCTSRV